ncbi:MAG: nitrous oxide reductase accessory protein NosL [Saprospiraceae bacterium]|nr:nitrous oxide reductase accessory protein NosL [Saprospiraceae bacterium]
MKLLTLLPFTFFLLLTACSTEPRPIEYGNEACFSCKMTIVDPQHAAELVSDKGKVFVFDAIECMVEHYKKVPDQSFAHILVNDFHNPGAFLNATQASYLISPQLPSPMGANLQAFSNLDSATEMQSAKGGQVLNWASLLEK